MILNIHSIIKLYFSDKVLFTTLIKPNSIKKMLSIAMKQYEQNLLPLIYVHRIEE